MGFELSDSSGTDDDLPPPHRNRFQSGAMSAMNRRSAVGGAASLPWTHTEMETEIHNIEQEAYSSVLRAFKAQSDAITWEMESLITELRKELTVTDEEHRKLLAQVNADDVIRRIREWRKARGLQPGMPSIPLPPHNPIPSPTASESRKRKKTTPPLGSLSIGAPSPVLPSSGQPSNYTARRGHATGSKGNKLRSYPSTDLTARTQVAGRRSGAFPNKELLENASYDPLIGRTVWTRWPEDNHFYEAVITDFNAEKGSHALVYDMNTPNETWEWVNLKEISPEDIKWEGGDPGIFRKGGRPRPGRGNKKSTARGGAGRGRGSTKGQSKRDLALTQNGVGKKAVGDITILQTDALIKEVEKVFRASRPDPTEIEKAKKVLEEHERSLVDAIARLEDASDGESDHGEHQGSDASKLARDGRVGSDEGLNI